MMQQGVCSLVGWYLWQHDLRSGLLRTIAAYAGLLMALVALLVPVMVQAESYDGGKTAAAAVAPDTRNAKAIRYDISVRIDPVTRKLEGHTVITANMADEFTVVLGRRFDVLDTTGLGPAGVTGRWRTWRVQGDGGAPQRIEVRWQGVLDPLNSSLDHRQTLGKNDPVSGEAGTFLPDSSAWYPYIASELATYQLTLELPAGQRGIVAGRLMEESDTVEGYRARFEFSVPTGGIDLMAGPYTIKTDAMRSTASGKPIRLRAYFHPEISNLASSYLDAVKGYIALYESRIGEYPFSEFSVVSSPTPTGFGMPTLTYLGIEVLRLPFILNTSLGHEVLHNWWGNGVYPDYTRGNWSEGLTTFMADYAYKERESVAAGRDMRLGWLRDFAALAPGQDMPLNTFTSRTHGSSQIVGYNKAAMVFFMLRDLLGAGVFDRALQAFWKEQRFREASWEDLQRAFEKASGQSLQGFFDQWLVRAGAPTLRLTKAKYARAGAFYAVTVTIEQQAPLYHVRVPLTVRTRQGDEVRMLDLKQEQQTFTLDVRAQPIEVLLDAELQLFRRMVPDEAPPILRQAMVDQTAVTVLLSDSPENNTVIVGLANKLQGREPKVISEAEILPKVPVLVIGLQSQVDAWLVRHQLPAQPEILRGKGSAQAWTVSRADGVMLAVVSARDTAALAALMRPLPHYGRQSYVVFDGARVIDKGAWKVRVQSISLE